MAIQQIEYDDKVAINIDSTIPDINKCNASDLNEIKSVVNGNSYETPKVSSQVDTDYKVNVLTTKNLFNKDNANVLNAFISTQGVITTNANNRSVYVSCKPNTTYTITRLKPSSGNNRFAVGYTDEIPAGSVQCDGFTRDDSKTSITITTDANAKYICAWIWVDDYTITWQQSIDVLQIEEGSTPSTYEAFIPNTINVNNEKYTDTINVGTSINDKNRVNVLKSKNLFDKDNWYKSYINPGNGDINSSNNAALFNYIKVKSSTIYSLKLDTNVLDLKVAYYTNNYTWISSSNKITTSTTITTPNNCEYIRIYINVDGNGIDQTKINNINFMLNEGSTALPYEPYVVPSINVDGEEIYNANLMNYSTSEQKIGTWIDGKPLYRKVFTITTETSFPYNTWVTFNNIILSGVNRIINCTYTALINAYTMPLIAYRDNSAKLNVLNLRNTTVTSSNFEIILEYTKSTD